MESARNSANKLWNAARFILMNIGDSEVPLCLPDTLTLEDKWILSRFNDLTRAVTENLEKYELGIAIQKLMDKYSLTLDDFDLMEVNEAFAAVPLVSCRGILGMTPEAMDGKVNINGSAVAVGHPIGATGARILMTLIYELRRSGKKSGVCAICSGMAQGDAMWVEV